MQLSSIISLQLKMQVNVSEERDQEVSTTPQHRDNFLLFPTHARRHRIGIAGAAQIKNLNSNQGNSRVRYKGR